MLHTGKHYRLRPIFRGYCFQEIYLRIAFSSFVFVLLPSRPEGLANAPYSPRRGESAQHRARDRGGIGLLWLDLFAICGFIYFGMENLSQCLEMFVYRKYLNRVFN